MGRAKNTLNAADVSSTPIKFRYTATYVSSSFPDCGITANLSVYVPYNVTMSSAEMQSSNRYRTVRQFYYQQAITGSVLNSASFWDPSWVSTAASGTYDATDYYFPTQASASLAVFSVPSSLFGEQIGRKTFVLKSTGVGNQFNIVDDGNGNLVDTLNNNIHVGNVFYSQGIAVVTNSDYVVPPLTVSNMASQLDEPLVTQADDNIII